MSVTTIFWLSVQVGLFSLLGAIAYTWSRRRGPSSGVACAVLVLGLSLPLALLAVSPWPRWELPQRNTIPKRESIAAVSPEPVTTSALDGNLAKGESPLTGAGAEGLVDSLGWQSVLEWFRTVDEPALASASKANAANLSRLVFWFLVMGVTLGLARFAYGLFAVYRYRRNSTRIENAALATMVEELTQRLKSPAVEVRETAEIRSAATIGWRKPLLLLPTDWQTWTEDERRVVLAHELAHVARNDYMLVMIARAATTVHFYQPLLLWLARQLRLQQELAADAQAAAVTGNRQSYLTTLAEMALRADERTIPWPARAFLPDTSLLVKRVSWLRNNKTSEERTMNRRSYGFLIAVLSALSICMAGIRPPGVSDDRATAGENIDTNGHSAEAKYSRTAKFLPAHAALIVVVSPNRLIEALGSTGRDLAGSFDRSVTLEKPLLDFEDLQYVFDLGPDMIHVRRSIYRTKEPLDWLNYLRKLSTKSMVNEQEVEGKKYFRIRGLHQNVANKVTDFFFIVPDAHTLVLATSEEEIHRTLEGSSQISAERFQEIGQSVAGALVDCQQLKNLVGSSQADPMTSLIKPIIENTDWFASSISMTPDERTRGKSGYGLHARFTCNSEAGAENVKETLSALKVLATNYLGEQVKLTPRENGPRNLTPGILSLVKLAHQVVGNITLESKAGNVRAQTAGVIAEDTIAAVLNPALRAAREAAMRTTSQNNLKQLALAFHIYADANKTDTDRRFPAPAILGKDRKHRHSWRVAILPYLEQQALYDQYRFDEPWDSEHNRKLIDKMPAIYRDPHALPNSTSSCYFMITGKGTIGDTEKGKSFKDITDGMAHTIMLVDAKRDIPWTKPEDIEVDPDKPLPAFGGFLEPKGMFLTAFCDGSVRVIASEIDPQLLRSMFTVGRGEVVGDVNGEPQPPAR